MFEETTILGKLPVDDLFVSILYSLLVQIRSVNVSGTFFKCHGFDSLRLPLLMFFYCCVDLWCGRSCCHAAFLQRVWQRQDMLDEFQDIRAWQQMSGSTVSDSLGRFGRSFYSLGMVARWIYWFLYIYILSLHWVLLEIKQYFMNINIHIYIHSLSNMYISYPIELLIHQ